MGSGDNEVENCDFMRFYGDLKGVYGDFMGL